MSYATGTNTKAATVVQLSGARDNQNRESTQLAAGGTDGAYAAQVLYVDGTSARTQRALVAMLREIIENGLKTVYRGF